MKGCLAFHAELNESWGKFIGKKEFKIDNDTCLTMGPSLYYVSKGTGLVGSEKWQFLLIFSTIYAEIG